MTEPLPGGGPEREILVRALRAYSDSCVPGALHPECPFSVQTSDGLGCGDECLDILSRVGEPPPPVILDLGHGYGLVPRERHRTRQGPPTGATGFDAEEINREERGQPISRWSPTTLLMQLLDQLAEPTPPSAPGADERRSQLQAMMSELYRRGIDTDALLRDVLIPSVARLPVAWAMVQLVAGDRMPADWSYARRSGWTPLLAGRNTFQEAKDYFDNLRSQGIPGQLVQQWVTEDVPKITSWMLSLTTDRLIDWAVPSTSEYQQTPRATEITGGDSQWLFERFTKTDLASWSTESLHREWEYVHGSCQPPCTPAQMRSRRIAVDELARAIADRATRLQATGAPNLLASKYTGVAADLLRKGERESAAAIFDAECTLSPRSAEALNNRGFCRLPDDPEMALKDLEKAHECGYNNPLLGYANRVLAMHRLGRNAIALGLADRAWAESQATSNAYVWDFRDPEPTLIETQNLRLYLSDMAVFIATAAGDERAAEMWQARRTSLDPPDASPDG
jgi:hypothetical protein